MDPLPKMHFVFVPSMNKLVVVFIYVSWSYRKKVSSAQWIGLEQVLDDEKDYLAWAVEQHNLCFEST